MIDKVIKKAQCHFTDDFVEILNLENGKLPANQRLIVKYPDGCVEHNVPANNLVLYFEGVAS